MSDKSVAGEVGNGGTSTFFELYFKGLKQPSSTHFVKQYAGANDNQASGMGSVSQQRLRILPVGHENNTHVSPQATYVACSGSENFPNIIRVYDAQNFHAAFVSHRFPLGLKARFGRSCRAFVNAWRAA